MKLLRKRIKTKDGFKYTDDYVDIDNAVCVIIETIKFVDGTKGHSRILVWYLGMSDPVVAFEGTLEECKQALKQLGATIIDKIKEE